jgi:hypothetical protein
VSVPAAAGSGMAAEVGVAGVASGSLSLSAVSFSSWKGGQVVLWAGDRREDAWAGRSGQHQL